MKKIANLFLVFLLLGSDIALADQAAANTSNANKADTPPQGGDSGYTNAESGKGYKSVNDISDNEKTALQTHILGSLNK